MTIIQEYIASIWDTVPSKFHPRLARMREKDRAYHETDAERILYDHAVQFGSGRNVMPGSRSEWSAAIFATAEALDMDRMAPEVAITALEQAVHSREGSSVRLPLVVGMGLLNVALAALLAGALLTRDADMSLLASAAIPEAAAE